MRIKNWLWVAIFCAVACGKSISLSTGSAQVSMKEIQTIVVFPFTNYSSTQEAGMIVASLIGQTWQSQIRNIKVIDVELAERLLAKKYVRISGRVHHANAVELGSILGADAVLIGTVLEYGTIRRARRQKVVKEPVAGIQVRLVRVKDGMILWSGITARSSEALVVPSRETPKDVATRAVNDLVSDYRASL